MITPALVEYIRAQLQNGVIASEVKNVLTEKGWNIADVEEAFATLGPQVPPNPTPPPATEPAKIKQWSEEAVQPTQPTTAENPVVKSGNLVIGASATPLGMAPAEPTATPKITSLVSKIKLPGKRIVAVVVVVTLLLILAVFGGVFAYGQLTNKSANVLQLAGEKMAAAKSFQFYGQIDSEIPPVLLSALPVPLRQLLPVPANPSAPRKYTLEITGQVVDGDNVTSRRGSLFFTLNEAPAEKEAPRVVSSLAGDLVFSANNLYLRLTNYPDSEATGSGQLKNRWLKSGYRGSFNIINELASLFSLSGKKTEVTLDGIKTARYPITLNTTAVSKINNDDSIRSSITQLKNLSGELYIGREDALPYRVTFTGKREGSNGSTFIDLNFRKFGELASVVEPAEAVTLDQLLTPTTTPTVTPSIKPTATPSLTPPPDPNLDRDSDGLPDFLETTYGTDPLKADTDGDGYKDGSEICDGYTPLGAGLMPDSMKAFPKPDCPAP